MNPAAVIIPLLVLLAIDWRQTVTIARNLARWYEKNALINWWMRTAVANGHLPEMGVHAHFIVSTVLILAVAGVLLLWGDVPALIWLVGWSIQEARMVWGNYRLGIKPASL